MNFQAKIENLTPRHSYYFRAYAVYAQGVACGNEMLVLIKPQDQVDFKIDGQRQLLGELEQLVYEDDDCTPVTALPAADWYFNTWQNLRSGDDALANPLTLRTIHSSFSPLAQFLPLQLSVQAKIAYGWILKFPYNRLYIELPSFSGGPPQRITVERSQNGGEFLSIATLTASQQVQYDETSVTLGQSYLYRLILLDESGQELGRSQEVTPL